MRRSYLDEKRKSLLGKATSSTNTKAGKGGSAGVLGTKAALFLEWLELGEKGLERKAGATLQLSDHVTDFTLHPWESMEGL